MRQRKELPRVLAVVAALLLASCGTVAAEAEPEGITRLPEGVVVEAGGWNVRLEVYGERMIRVTAAKGAIPPDASLSIVAHPVKTGWQLALPPGAAEISTASLRARVDRATGAVSLSTINPEIILSETDSGRAMPPSPLGKTDANGAVVTAAAQTFSLSPGEGIFGLGQHPGGRWNYRGTTVHLQQRNMDIAVPFLLSTKGYGILWDNPAISDVDVGIKGAEDALTLRSEAGTAIDYYFVYGPAPDEVVHGYRQLTGAVPMFGKYAWGYWQSRERYVTQEELLGVAREYRKRGIPIDGMVQDWQYWFPQPWGSHAFGTNFPDPKGMVDELHAAHLHAIISVWGKFDKGSANYDELSKAGYLFAPVYENVYPKGSAKWYDPFSAGGRELYWRQISREIFARGFDGWWLDATEPELGGKWGEIRDLTTAAGPGYRVANAYPLMTTSGVYSGQRAETSDKRVFILTRSAFAGQQRNAAVSWSGDIVGNWETLKSQVPNGLNFVASGIPYWNTDIGGFFSQSNADEEYRELYARWFEFGAFCPMFRSHGTGTKKEMWAFGPEIERVLVKYDRLRYRLLPYIYSTAWRVTSEDYTMMRPLLMDFPADATAVGTSDQFMFGPALMACPVTEPGPSSVTVIPATQLADKTGAIGGLSGTYYQGEAFEEKRAERVDETIDFNWDKSKREGVGENRHRDPIPGLKMDHFSARWEGFLMTTEAGDYKIQLGADDGMRLWLDGKLVIEDWAARRLARRSVTVALPAHAKIPLKIEYFQRTNEAIIELRWQPPTASTAATQERSVYLPAGTWTDFWTGKATSGGRKVTVPVPLEVMPVFVRPGSIVPMGPNVQHADEPSDPIEVRVYRGADGKFDLYEDEGDGYGYERGQHSIIPMTWDDRAGVLTIGARSGEFPGMLKERTFRVVVVGENHGAGVGSLDTTADAVDRVVHYSGAGTTVR